MLTPNARAIARHFEVSMDDIDFETDVVGKDAA